MGDESAVLGKGKKTRARILEGAEVVFGAHNYHDATIVDITRSAGVALGTFYVHFESKRAIYEELVKQRGFELQEAIRQEAGKHATHVDRQSAGFRAFFGWIAQHPQMYRIVRRAWDEDRDLVQGWYDAFAGAYANALKLSMDAGEIAPADPELLAFSMMGAADFIAMRHMVWSDAPLPEAKIDEFAAIVTRFLAPHLVPSAP